MERDWGDGCKCCHYHGEHEQRSEECSLSLNAYPVAEAGTGGSVSGGEATDTEPMPLLPRPHTVFIQWMERDWGDGCKCHHHGEYEQ